MSDTTKHSEEFLAYSRFFRLMRPLAYSNEVGESFRHTFPKCLPAAYALTGLYIVGDIGRQVHQAKPRDRAKMALDASLFHLSASLVLPTLTVASVVHGTKLIVRGAKNPKVRLWTPVLAGLSSIPFIIHPIDSVTDHVMNGYIRDKIWQS